jgi:hypothetical protein
VLHVVGPIESGGCVRCGGCVLVVRPASYDLVSPGQHGTVAMGRAVLAVGLLLMAGVQSQAQDDFCARLAVLSAPRFYDRIAFLLGLVDIGADKQGVLGPVPVKSVLPGYGECVVEFTIWRNASGRFELATEYRYRCRREKAASPRTAQHAVRRCLDATWTSQHPQGTHITFNRPARDNPYKNPGCRGDEITVGGEDGRYIAFEENYFWCEARVSRRKAK